MQQLIMLKQLIKLFMNRECKTCGPNKLTTAQLIAQMDDQRKPYTEEIIDGHTKIRHFDPLAEDHLFKWHWDEEDRWIESINENDWQFQFDNELPQSLQPKKIIFIQAGQIHRIIKGHSNISIYIRT
jgi:hypothetical protein